MYTLREIPAGYPVRNICLGDTYTTILKETNQKEFEEACKLFWNDENPGHTYGFVVCENGSKTIPLMEGCYYYVMADNGKTFDNLTLR